MPDIRPARKSDAADLARLVNIAGEGMPLILWASMTPPGGDVWHTGTERASREVGSFTWRNAAVATIGDQVAAALVAYVTETDPLDDETPAMFRPLIELENMVPGTLYINVLAAYPQFIKQGLGTALMGAAIDRAEARPLTLIVADGNATARHLYERSGFVEVAQRPIVATDGWTTTDTAWVLMRRG